MQANNIDQPSTRDAYLRVRFIGYALLLLLMLGAANAQLSFPEFDITDVPGVDAFTDNAYVNCLTEGDPAACFARTVTDRGEGRRTTVSDDDQAVISLIESDYAVASLGLPPAIEAFFLNAMSTPPAIHLAHKTEYEQCVEAALEKNEAFADCGHTWTTRYPSIAAPQENYDAYKKAVDQIWDTFFNNVIDDIHRALNQGAGCLQPARVICSLVWLIGPQPPVVDPLCVTSRLMVAWPEAFVKHYPQMWADIGEATLRHLPNTVAFGLDFTNPLDPLRNGSLIAPIADVSIENLFDAENLLSALGIPLSLTDLLDPSAIAGMDFDARQNLYYHEPLIAQLTGIVVNTPILPGESKPDTLGVDAFEANKRALEANTGIMYENIGYTMMSQLTAPVTNVNFSSFDWRRIPMVKPSLEIRCFEGNIPTGVAIPIPVFQRVAKPGVDLLGVAEGYLVPSTAGDMISLY